MKKLSAFALLLTCCHFLVAQARPAITGIAFVSLYTGDPEAAAKLYDNDMGFIRTKIGTEDFYSVSDSQWFQIAPLHVPEVSSHLAAVGFTTRDEAGLERYLRAHGQSILPEAERGRFAVKDPEGNLIVFVQEGMKHPGSSVASPRATSHRIIHAGFIVRDAAAEDRFYKDLLGFHPYWHGGKTPERTDYVSLQVPDGSDWLEYMLNNPAIPDLHTYGMMNHFSLGTETMDQVVTGLAANKCTKPICSKTQVGVDGKVQLNLFDPDQTRIEYMEFKPSSTPCCSPFMGKHPTATEDK
ncbi:VOC family protein [Granulicella arctica]|uniref:VOC family protein n=1 Tax=Granulicella arctica TaxID=940613 RepID=UPI0021DFFCBD|nr:VOC family protein [Granulicella arctica]